MVNSKFSKSIWWDVIQKMILEYVNPNYEVRLFNNNVEVDTSKGIFVLEWWY